MFLSILEIHIAQYLKLLLITPKGKDSLELLLNLLMF